VKIVLRECYRADAQRMKITEVTARWTVLSMQDDMLLHLRPLAFARLTFVQRIALYAFLPAI